MRQLRFTPALLLAALLAFSAAPANAQRVDAGVTKSTATIKTAFEDAVKAAGRSTVRILIQDESDKPDHKTPAAYGTVVSADGFILTKSSEVISHKQIFVKLPSGDKEAKIIGVRESYDLAMLKIDGKNLVPVTFANTAQAAGSGKPELIPPAPLGRRGQLTPLQRPTGPIPVVAPAPKVPSKDWTPVVVGEFVITPEASASEGKDLAPKNYGVISVERRNIPFTSGVLGVALADDPSLSPAGAVVTDVFMQSGAGRAGVKPNDIITAVDGTTVTSRLALQNLIRRHYPTDTVTLSVTRGDQQLQLRVQLGDTILATPEDVEMAILSGQVNTRASDFQAVFQHDTILAPSEMGGPLVDLDGKVIGINIARAGRTETYAIPADLLTDRWLDSMKDGTFAPHKKP